MTWLESLKSFIEHIFHISIRINSPEINIINITDREPINIDQNGSKITVNVQEFDKDQRKELDSIIRKYYEEEGEILTNRLQDCSDRFSDYEKHNSDKELLTFYNDKIPKDDYEALRSSLFMRALFKENAKLKFPQIFFSW